MSSINHFIQNRPVHLARRDVYYEKAVRGLDALSKNNKKLLDAKIYDEIVFLFKVSRLHSRFSVRTPGENENDEQFQRYIDLMAGNLKAVLATLELRDLVVNNSSFEFLGKNYAAAELYANEYQRRAKDILNSVMATLNLADETFQHLKQLNNQSLNEEEKTRYEKTYKHVEKLMKNKKHRYALAPTLGRLGENN